MINPLKTFPLESLGHARDSIEEAAVQLESPPYKAIRHRDQLIDLRRIRRSIEQVAKKCEDHDVRTNVIQPKTVRGVDPEDIHPKAEMICVNASGNSHCRICMSKIPKHTPSYQFWYCFGPVFSTSMAAKCYAHRGCMPNDVYERCQKIYPERYTK